MAFPTIVRRVRQAGFRRYLAKPADAEAPYIFTYHPKIRWMGIAADDWLLYWEGDHIETSSREEDLLLYILRFAYGAQTYQLLPSEVLADARLVYEGIPWVDQWNRSAAYDNPGMKRQKVILARGPIIRPPDRRIIIGEPLRPWKSRKAALDAVPTTQRPQRAARKAPKPLEIPKIDFEALERPRQRRRTISRDWSDPQNQGYVTSRRFYRMRGAEPSDEECLLELKSGLEAKKASES